MQQPIRLEVHNLSKTFTLHMQGKKVIEALRSINFTLYKGEALGLTGKSGAGKSTLMKCIYRTYLASSGNIWYHDDNGQKVDLVSAADRDVLNLRRNKMTYCSQFLRVIPRVPAVDIVAEPLMIKVKDWESARIAARQLLSDLSLDEELWDAYPVTFSGGEQQRINIARAIVNQPQFLLVDEPTASLDIKTKDIVIDKILELKRQGSSILCISHDKYTLDRLSDRQLHLQTGNLAQVSA